MLPRQKRRARACVLALCAAGISTAALAQELRDTPRRHRTAQALPAKPKLRPTLETDGAAHAHRADTRKAGSAEGSQEPKGGGEQAPPSGYVTRDSLGNKLSIDDKGITFVTPDDDVKFRIGGKLQLDFGTARIRDFRFTKPYNDNFEVRRSWIESYLTLYNSIELAFQYDFADDMRPINDAVIAYRGFDPFIFSIGNFKEPFSLNQLISDNNTLFTERSLADAFAPARDFGAAVGTHGDKWTLVGGVFGNNANLGITDNGVAGTARLTYAPILTKDEVLHLGIAGSYRSLDRTGTAPTFSTKPESYVFTTQLVSTSSIKNAEDVGRVGLEAAYQTCPLRVQGEYMWVDVSRYGGQPSTSFNGGYIEAGYTINGNGRPYDLAPKYGSTYAVFGAPKLDTAQQVSQGGIGIFELGTRVSYVDLSDRNVTGGRQIDYTFGVNWYPEKNVKVMADYVRAHASYSPAAGRSVDSDVFVARFQLYW